jgi:hypothetical protein
LSRGKSNLEPNFNLKLNILKDYSTISEIFPRLNEKDGLLFSHKVADFLPENLKLGETVKYAIKQSEIQLLITETRISRICRKYNIISPKPNRSDSNNSACTEF